MAANNLRHFIICLSPQFRKLRNLFVGPLPYYELKPEPNYGLSLWELNLWSYKRAKCQSKHNPSFRQGEHYKLLVAILATMALAKLFFTDSIIRMKILRGNRAYECPDLWSSIVFVHAAYCVCLFWIDALLSVWYLIYIWPRIKGTCY